MLILALETATDLASCALLRDGQIFSTDCPRTPDQAGQHSATLLPAVKKLLDEQSLCFADLDAIAFDYGPGAFTGLRMGCALAQGLAVAQNKPILPIGSLEAMAWLSFQQNSLERVTALLDARMGEVYSASFLVGADHIEPCGTLRVGPPAELMLEPSTECYCGNGLSAYPEMMSRTGTAACLPELLPHAKAIAELAALALLRGAAISPENAAPRYVRDRVAKTIAERLAEGGKA